MAHKSILEMENLNGTNFELWKLKMDDLVVDIDIWVAISKTKPPYAVEDLC